MEKETNKNLKRIEIVLVDTQNSENIGSVCRAMKTMNVEQLTIVSDKKYDENKIKTLSLHSFDLWENRKECLTLKEALNDSILAVAATRRHGKYRKMSCVTPEELAQKISEMPDGKISIVFGCESNGLSDKQVKECSMVVTIPTSKNFPSLNLAQAVQIICYCLYSKLKNFPMQSCAVSLSRIEKTVNKCVESLNEICYFKSIDELHFTSEFLKDQFARCAMSESEIKYFEKIFTKKSSITKYKN